MKKTILLLLATVLLTACGSDKNNKNNAQEVLASLENDKPSVEELEAMLPTNPSLAAKYERSCFICHANYATGAPVVGDKEAWSKRMKEKGMEGLLKSINEGLKAMPPKGICMDCSTEEFTDLINFMAGTEQ